MVKKKSFTKKKIPKKSLLKKTIKKNIKKTGGVSSNLPQDVITKILNELDINDLIHATETNQDNLKLLKENRALTAKYQEANYIKKKKKRRNDFVSKLYIFQTGVLTDAKIKAQF